MRQDEDSKKEIDSNHTSDISKFKYIVNSQREQAWLKENKEAIDKQNERIQKYGCFSDEHRRF